MKPILRLSASLTTPSRHLTGLSLSLQSQGYIEAGAGCYIGEPTPEELIAAAEVEKSALNTAANAVMAPIQDGVDLDIATDEESKRYTEWRRYRVLLSRVNTATAPDKPE